MAKYLITGASGFVGRHLITRLQQSEAEAEVLATDMQETLPFTEPKVAPSAVITLNYLPLAGINIGLWSSLYWIL